MSACAYSKPALNPLSQAGIQLDLGQRAHTSHVVVDGDEDTARTQAVQVVGKDVDNAGQVHQQKPADGGVERFLIEECARVTEAKVDIAEAEPVPTLHGHGDLGGIQLDAHHGSVGPDHLGDLKRDVARPGAEVEDPHPGPNAAALKEQSRRFGEECGLRLQTRDLSVVAA